MSRVLAIGDLHAPYQNKNAIKNIIDTYREYNCDTIICMGDDFDNHCFSQYLIEPEAKNADDELKEAAEFISLLFNTLESKLSYSKPVIVVEGNHNQRLLQKASRSGIPHRLIRTIKRAYKLPKQWLYKKWYRKDGVTYFHGSELGGVHAFTHSIYAWQSSVVYAHLHADAGIKFVLPLSHKLMFAMNVGCMIDRHAPVFRYDKRSRTRPIVSLGVIIEGTQPILKVFDD